MSSKTSTSKTRKTRSFDVLLPRLSRADEGITFAAGNYVRRTGTVPALLTAVRLSGSPLGIHAAAKDGTSSLCGLALTPNGKSEAEVKATGQAAKVALAVTCKFCEARLVGAGVKPASEASKYAADYGSRDAERELAALEAEAEKAEKAEKGKVKATA